MAALAEAQSRRQAGCTILCSLPWPSWSSPLFTNALLLPALLSLPCHHLQEKKQKEREARSGFRVEQTFNLEDFILPWASGELGRPSSGAAGVVGTLATSDMGPLKLCLPVDLLGAS